jgi:uncharacterized coiled-coil DUF342 family protein
MPLLEQLGAIAETLGNGQTISTEISEALCKTLLEFTPSSLTAAQKKELNIIITQIIFHPSETGLNSDIIEKLETLSDKLNPSLEGKNMSELLAMLTAEAKNFKTLSSTPNTNVTKAARDLADAHSAIEAAAAPVSAPAPNR